jgi:hypothetical protein
LTFQFIPEKAGPSGPAFLLAAGLIEQGNPKFKVLIHILAGNI